MIKIILFLALFTFENSLAQDKASSQNFKEKKNIKTPPLYQSFEDKLNNLTESQRNKFYEINSKYTEELLKNQNEYRNKIKEITKSPIVIVNFETIFSGQELKRGGREMPASMKLVNEKIFNDYKKLSPDQRKKVRVEIINYRKAMNKAQKEKRVALKNLFKHDFEMFYETEDISKINNDEKLINQEFHKKN